MKIIAKDSIMFQRTVFVEFVALAVGIGKGCMSRILLGEDKILQQVI